MLKKEIFINAKNGLHIRPAAKLVKEAKKFNSEIIIEYNNKKVNAKSLFKIQTLGVLQGDKINILIKGNDEQKAFDHLLNIIKNLE
ncbi:HPr family phosphocarrier protein [Enterobacteriaceae bacterium ET-AT1-13]|nr:HPr family phosphocarrier protein [Enterobacteriaceae bacterium ET-AT1-13]WGS66502.1 HPr family phosphocarrier protein [Enterobacteriaceae bacterium Cmel17]WMC17526.1 MAG: HPr family phosphocarrier protein [Enterobacteriaceae bacterium Cmel21]WMC17733.1 MAG: HPr family phosphocarrier protein [Enterobacteriaceae bacterium PSmelAO3-2]WMC17937.1 MAG: HPr family phosphocarrier protein [Enterobacteriaceae bacterium PSmelAO3-1]WMC18139.1 MAG: HPr family phosphocarrier protein [Enterobacteriaceae 